MFYFFECVFSAVGVCEWILGFEVTSSIPSEVFFLFLCLLRSGVRGPLRSFFYFYFFEGTSSIPAEDIFFIFYFFEGGGFDSRRGHFFYFLFFEVGGSIPAEDIFFIFLFWYFWGFRIWVFWGIFGW